MNNITVSHILFSLNIYVRDTRNDREIVSTVTRNGTVRIHVVSEEINLNVCGRFCI